jgi:AcrR family transcriptional regulator
MEVKPRRGPGRPRNEEADREIVSACLAVLSEQGYDRCSIEAVAARAGVTRATVYRRHATKADLVSAALSTLAGVEEPAETSAGLAAVVGLVEQFRSCMEACDGLSIVASLYLHRDEHPEMLEEFRDRVVHPGRNRLVAALSAARDAGELRADADVELAADALMGGFLTRVLTGVPLPAGWAEQTVRGIWRGLAADAR